MVRYYVMVFWVAGDRDNAGCVPEPGTLDLPDATTASLVPSNGR